MGRGVSWLKVEGANVSGSANAFDDIGERTPGIQQLQFILIQFKFEDEMVSVDFVPAFTKQCT